MASIVKFLFGRKGSRSSFTLRERILRSAMWSVLAAVGLSMLTTIGLRFVDPPTSAFMLRSAYEAHTRGRRDFQLRHYWVDWDHISPHAKAAVIAAEDQRFADHPGFDLEAIADAVHERVTQGRQRGASTISQQVAKNLFLWPGENFVRKGLEAWFTVQIEHFWPKQRILEVYLNIAQFGDGIFGVEAASVAFYGKNAKALTAREAALLAAVLPNPRKHRVDRPSQQVLSRSRWIQSQVDMLGGPRFVRSLGH